MRRVLLTAFLFTGLVSFGINANLALADDISIAIFNDNLPKVARMINADPNILVKRVDWQGTPLHYAAQQKKIEAVKLLLKKGAPVNAVSKTHGVTPLYYAVAGLDIESTKALLAAGANADHRNAKTYSEYPSPIDVAVQKGSLELIKLLHKNGADINGVRALHSAVASAAKSPLILAYLLANKADPNKSGALTYAARHADAKVLTQLLDAGGDLHKSQYYAENLLTLAAGDLAKVKLLVERGIKLNREDLSRGELPVLAAVAQQGNVNVLSYLLAQGFSIESPVDDLPSEKLQLRALNDALNVGHKDMAAALIKAGVEPTFCALIAIGDKKAVAEFCKAAPDALDSRTHHERYVHLSPLHVAVLYRQHDILRLLASKATPRQLNASNFSTEAKPLHFAAQLRDATAARILLEAGADPNSRLTIGLYVGGLATPLDLLNTDEFVPRIQEAKIEFTDEQHEATVAVLKKHGAKTSAELKQE